jgi:hypothetical protein
VDTILATDVRADGTRDSENLNLVFYILERNDMVQITAVLNLTVQALIVLKAKTIRAH